MLETEGAPEVLPELKFCQQSAEKKLQRTQAVRGGLVVKPRNRGAHVSIDNSEQNYMSIPVPKIRELHYLYTIKPQGRTVAHCLDLDIVTAADDIDEAEKRLDFLVTLQIEYYLNAGNYAALMTTAPKVYFDRFNECVRAGKSKIPKNPVLRIRVPDVVPMDQPFGSIGVLAATSAAA